MNSCIYRGRVLHRRLRPVEHAFRYKLFMMYLDLDELPNVFKGRWCWSTRWPALAWFRRREHMGAADLPLGDAVRSWIRQQTGAEHQGPIRLLTHLRYFGYQMNPVSFFFCFDKQENLKHIVAEVNNTPWGEQHCYLLQPQHFAPQESSVRQEMEKEFHVSPFMPMDMTYRWRVSDPGERLNIGISNFQDQQRMLSVAMSMEKQPLTARTLRGVLLRYPFMTTQVFAGIYWQAFRLWRKKVTFFAHPKKQSSESNSPNSPSNSSKTASHNV